MRMTFGKFKGYCLDDLPDDYLIWLTSIELRHPLSYYVSAEIFRRRLEPNHREEPRAIGLDTGKVKKVYRSLAFQYHPDKIGGNGDVMKGINLFYEAIRQ